MTQFPTNSTQQVEEVISDARIIPLWPLFTSNIAPSEKEAAFLQEGVHTLRNKIFQFPSDRSQLEEELRLYYCALSPVRRVPPEVLEEIFVHVDTKDLAIITLVCHAWRSAAFTALRKRDSELEIEFDPKDGIPYDRIRAWMLQSRKSTGKRSLKLAPDLAVSCGYRGVTDRCYWVDSQFSGLLSDIASSSIQLNLGITLCCLQGLLTNDSWHSLSSLNLEPESIQWQPLQQASAMYEAIFNHLPRALKTLKLSMRPYRGSAYKFAFPPEPYGSLTTLALDCHWKQPIDVASLLRQCRNLEIMRINFGYHHIQVHEQHDGEPEVFLPRLRSLTMRNVMPWVAPVALHLLRVPSLTHFTLEYPPHSYFRMTDKHALRTIMDSLNLLSRSQGSILRSLVVYRTEVNATSLADVFASLPFLEYLVLDSVQFDAEELLQLECSRTQTIPFQRILPNLKRLDLRGVTKEFRTSAFLQYLEMCTVKGKKVEDHAAEGGVDVLKWITIRYESWGAECKANWRDCKGAVRKLHVDFGIVVERIVADDEWAEHGMAFCCGEGEAE